MDAPRGTGKQAPKRSSRIPNPSIRRMARRGGVLRATEEVNDVARDALHDFLERIIHDALQYMESGKRKTVTVNDIHMALKHNGRDLYG